MEKTLNILKILNLKILKENIKECNNLIKYHKDQGRPDLKEKPIDLKLIVQSNQSILKYQPNKETLREYREVKKRSR